MPATSKLCSPLASGMCAPIIDVGTNTAVGHCAVSSVRCCTYPSRLSWSLLSDVTSMLIFDAAVSMAPLAENEMPPVMAVVFPTASLGRSWCMSCSRTRYRASLPSGATT
jgi:hypothetical protein